MPKILGIDPGKRESWWTLLESSQVGLHTRWVLHNSGHLELDPDLPLAQRLPYMYQQVENLLRNQRASLVVAERFISRPGRGMGNVAEIVNLLLGILFSLCQQKKIPWLYVMPSVHKMWWERTFIRDITDRWPQLNAHEVDACSLAIFGHYHSYK
jgi:Holliday junction resolvasome RuvABC endonuclease subunit